jgi:chromosome segregation ATPase
MESEIKRRGSVVYIKKPEALEDIIGSFERGIHHLGKEYHEFIQKEEKKKKGILPTLIRLQERSEKDFESGMKASRFRHLRFNLDMILKEIPKMNYNQLLNTLKTIDEEYNFVKERQAELKKKKKSIDEKLVALLQQEKPMDEDERRLFESSHAKMKKTLLDNIVKREREIKKLGKVV